MEKLACHKSRSRLLKARVYWRKNAFKAFCFPSHIPYAVPGQSLLHMENPFVGR